MNAANLGGGSLRGGDGSGRRRGARDGRNRRPRPGRERPRDSGRRDSLLVLGIALAVRVVHLLEAARLPWWQVFQMDARYHAEWARRLAEDGWRDPEPFFRAPFYPYLLGLLRSLTGEIILGPRLLQTVLGIATAVLVHRISRRLLPPRWALVAGIAAAVTWTTVHFESELLLEPVLTFLTTLLLFLMVRTQDRAVSPAEVLLWGAVAGLGTITRPNLVLFLPALPLFAAALLGSPTTPAAASGVLRTAPHRRFLRAAVLVGLGFLIPILPVWIHNARHGDAATVVAWQGGINFYIGNNPQSNGWSAIAPGMRTDWRGGYEDALRLAREGTGRAHLRPSEVSAFWTRQGLRFWKEDPGAALTLLGRKVLFFWANEEIKNNEDPRFFRQRLRSLRWLPVSFGLLAPLALVGLLLAWGKGGGGRLIALFVAVWFVSIVPFFVCSRYRLPVTPLLPILSLFTLRAAADWVRRRRWPTLAAATTTLAFLYIVLFSVRSGAASGEFYQSWCNLGDAHAELRQWREAEASFRRSLEVNPGYPNSWNNLGLALEAQGRIPEAEAAYRQGLEAVPGHPMLRKNLGVVLRTQGRPAEAETLLVRLTREYPQAWDLAALLGQVREDQGRGAAAESAYTAALDAQPLAVPIRLRVAALQAARGDTSAARASLEEGLRLEPGRAELRNALFRLARRRVDEN